MRNNNIPVIIEGPPPATSASSRSRRLYMNSTIDRGGPARQKVQVEVEKAPLLPTGRQPPANEESDSDNTPLAPLKSRKPVGKQKTRGPSPSGATQTTKKAPSEIGAVDVSNPTKSKPKPRPIQKSKTNTSDGSSSLSSVSSLSSSTSAPNDPVTSEKDTLTVSAPVGQHSNPAPVSHHGSVPVLPDNQGSTPPSSIPASRQSSKAPAVGPKHATQAPAALSTTDGRTAPAAALDAPIPGLNDPQWDWQTMPAGGPVAPTPSGTPLSPSMIATPRPVVVTPSPFGVPPPVTAPQPGLGDEGKGLSLAPASRQQQKLRAPSSEPSAFGMIANLTMPQPRVVAPSPLEESGALPTAPSAITKRPSDAAEAEENPHKKPRKMTTSPPRSLSVNQEGSASSNRVSTPAAYVKQEGDVPMQPPPPTAINYGQASSAPPHQYQVTPQFQMPVPQYPQYQLPPGVTPQYQAPGGGTLQYQASPALTPQYQAPAGGTPQYQVSAGTSQYQLSAGTAPQYLQPGATQQFQAPSGATAQYQGPGGAAPQYQVLAGATPQYQPPAGATPMFQVSTGSMPYPGSTHFPPPGFQFTHQTGPTWLGHAQWNQQAHIDQAATQFSSGHGSNAALAPQEVPSNSSDARQSELSGPGFSQQK